MTVGRILGTIAVVALLATVALFFFPAAHGSYMATHGPTTAFRLQSEMVLLLICLTLSVLIVVFGQVPIQLLHTIVQTGGHSGPSPMISIRPAILRC